MAKFIKEYNIHLGDAVRFEQDGIYQEGIVQDISQLPDVFVEGFDNKTREYKRWRKDIERIEWIYSKSDDYGRWSRVEFDDGENVEFVHKGDVDTPEFNEIEYIPHLVNCKVEAMIEKQRCDECNNVKGCINCTDGDQWAHIEEIDADKMTEAMEESVDSEPVITYFCPGQLPIGAYSKNSLRNQFKTGVEYERNRHNKNLNKKL